MAIIISKPTVELSIIIQLKENEAAALSALAGYGIDEFIKCFYEKMGKHYLQPHESGLRTLFQCVNSTIPGYLQLAEGARKSMTVG